MDPKRIFILALFAVGLLQLTPKAQALPTEAYMVASQAPRAGRLAGVVVQDTATVAGEALQVVRLPVGIAGAALGILPGVKASGGRNIARGIAAPFRTAGAILKVPAHLLGAL